MIKYCAKCKASFECKATDILNCHCQHVRLDPHQSEQLSAQFSDCLCPTCLRGYATKLPIDSKTKKVSPE